MRTYAQFASLLAAIILATVGTAAQGNSDAAKDKDKDDHGTSVSSVAKKAGTATKDAAKTTGTVTKDAAKATGTATKDVATTAAKGTAAGAKASRLRPRGLRIPGFPYGPPLLHQDFWLPDE